jgi:phage shock protein C
MMKTRTRTAIYEEESSSLYDDTSLDLEALSDDELDTLLFDEESETPKSMLNLPTLAGLSLILVGIAYIFQQLGLWGAGIDLTVLASLLPWLAGIFIILLGFGVLSWRPNKKNKKKIKIEKKLAKSQKKKSRQSKVDLGTISSDKRKLYKSHDKKLSGVCGGIGDYFGIDATLVRIAFVVGTIATGGPPFILAYLLLSFIMPSSEKNTTLEERITIIRDS